MNNQVAKFIKDARAKLGLTQDQFADLLNTPRSNIAKYETGHADPPAILILKIEALQKNIEWEHQTDRAGGLKNGAFRAASFGVRLPFL